MIDCDEFKDPRVVQINISKDRLVSGFVGRHPFREGRTSGVLFPLQPIRDGAGKHLMDADVS